MLERHFQKQVIQLAHLYGWKVAHFATAPTQSGHWATPVQADGKGFPDLILVKDRVIYAELKGENGRPRPEQVVWAQTLTAAGQEVYLWYPDDFDKIKRILCSAKPAPTPAA